MRPPALKLLSAGAWIVAYFLLLAGGGLRIDFTGDDLMNLAYLHGYGRVPLGVVFCCWQPSGFTGRPVRASFG